MPFFCVLLYISVLLGSLLSGYGCPLWCLVLDYYINKAHYYGRPME